MVKIIRTGKYEESLKNLLSDDPSIINAINFRISLFKRNPEDTRLHNHALKKRMKGKWAFSITDDIRIVYKWLNKNTVRFLAIGPHYKVYGRRSRR